MNETNRCIYSGMQILFEQKWLKDHAVVVEDNLIKSIIPTEMIAHHLPARRVDYPEDHYLIPGMIDLHIHGARGHDVMDATEESFHAISQALAAEGVTGFLATTMTASASHIEKVLTAVPTAMQIQTGAAVLGVHLEGPFIAKAKSGAQSEKFLQLPDVALMKQWQKLSQGNIKLVTLAPELPGALQLIKSLHEMNVVSSVGHTHATYSETRDAIAAGCTHATHLFNAMSGLRHREPGAVGALLLADEVNAELIVDNVHLHPAIVELALRLKGKDRLILVTDAMRAKCMGDGVYELGGQKVIVRENRAALADGTLAGSVLTMPQAVKNMVKFTRCSLIEAVGMASRNPAGVLGIEAKKGTIAVGKDADLAVLDKELEVMMTVREGRKIFSVE